MCMEDVSRLTFLDFLISITYHDIPSLGYETRLLLCYLPSLALGNPQSSQGPNIFVTHVFNKDPRGRKNHCQISRNCSLYKGKLSHEAPGGLWFHVKKPIVGSGN